LQGRITEEEDVDDDDRALSILREASRNGGGTDSAAVQGHKRAISEYADPNNMPPLAPVVFSGDVPGVFYNGIPLKSETSMKSVGEESQSNTSQTDDADIASPTNAKTNTNNNCNKSFFERLDISRRSTKGSTFNNTTSTNNTTANNFASIFNSLTSTPTQSPSTQFATALPANNNPGSGMGNGQFSNTLPRPHTMSSIHRPRTLNNYAGSVHQITDDAASMISKQSHRFSTYATSIASSATTTPVHYDGFSPTGESFEGAGMRGGDHPIAIWKMEGHTFFEVSLVASALDLGGGESASVAGTVGSSTAAAEDGDSTVNGSVKGLPHSASESRLATTSSMSLNEGPSLSSAAGTTVSGMGATGSGSALDMTTGSHATRGSRNDLVSSLFSKSTPLGSRNNLLRESRDALASNAGSAAGSEFNLHSSHSTMNSVKKGPTGTTGVSKGQDNTMKPAENLCRLCCEDLKINGATTALKCECKISFLVRVPTLVN
jgi:hypothetical protein